MTIQKEEGYMIDTKKAMEILSNNKKWPIIFLNVDTKIFKSATILPANTLPTSLGILPCIEGYTIPQWLYEVEKKAAEKDNILLIDKIDEIEINNQLKFNEILKHKTVSAYSLPLNTQIVLTATDLNKINSKILSLTISFNAKQF